MIAVNYLDFKIVWHNDNNISDIGKRINIIKKTQPSIT